MSWLFVGLGGFIGSVGRFYLTRAAQNSLGGLGVLYGTLLVNVLGCFMIGFLMTWVMSKGGWSQEQKLFLFVGLLGGFTTYSTFALEAVQLMKAGAMFKMVLNVAFHLVLGFSAVFAGSILARNFS